ncbi:hypothetical protein CEXT_418941 [Caerostris extrusa]|uniref:Uncharacterized protein n=1 Tax=Caerostris extrusa TaxID=172846 RepID=A0AAV4P986_CAEEX|nr:hypothetical protein CEXT_418941 [Caerostris extrusa]
MDQPSRIRFPICLPWGNRKILSICSVPVPHDKELTVSQRPAEKKSEQGTTITNSHSTKKRVLSFIPVFRPTAVLYLLL